MESMKLKLIIHSAKDLKDVKHIGTMDPYAIIWIAGGASDSKFKTNTVKKGGSNPVWDAPIEFNIDLDAAMHANHVLVCEIKHDGKLLDKIIGQVQVPLKHLLSVYAWGVKVSYPVMSHSGGVQGTLILSYTLVSEGSEADISSTADGEPSDPPANEPHRSRRERIVHHIVDISSVTASAVSIAASLL